MKNISLLTIAFLFMIAGCDVLDVEPYHSIPSEQAILTKKDVESAVTGSYSALQSASYYGRNFIVAGDLAADNLTWTGTTAGYNQIDNNSILADNVIVEGIWTSIYSLISRVNIVIERIPEIDGLTEEEANGYIAELRFLRALAHFDLVRTFGPVPVRTRPASVSEEDLNVPREPVETVYAQVFSDLAFAEGHIRTTTVRGRASLPVVLALKARVSLYYYSVEQQNDLLVGAIDATNRVINDFNYSMADDFASLYDGNPNTESIFEVDFTEQTRNRLAEYFFPTSLSGRREFAPTMKLYNYFAANDKRKDASIALDDGSLYSIKYNDILTGTDNVYVLRLAEMHLIRAEARVLLQTSLPDARDDINLIRERAGLPAIITTSPFLLSRQIADMRQLEFAFEGHRWFDLVRTGQAIEELDNVSEDYQTLFPIPLGELLTNFHEGMFQNEGY